MGRGQTTSRREELLGIAARLFAAHGFANVTVDDIGAAAGVSGPALYHHFEGKEALLGELLVGVSNRLLEGGRALADPLTPDTLGALVRFHCRFAVRESDLIAIHYRDLSHATPPDQWTVRRLQGRYVRIWVDAMRARHPGVEPRAATAAVHAAFGLMNSTPYSSSLSTERMERLLNQMVISALDGAAVAASA